jgi:hypothetical protein
LFTDFLTKDYLTDQIKKNEMDGACGMYGGEERFIQGFGGKLKRKRRLGRCRCRWKDDIKVNLKEVGWEIVDWIDLAHDRDKWQTLMNVVMNLWVP